MGANPLAFPLLLTVGSVANAAYYWKSISSSVPIWWNVDGSPLLWTPKWVGVSIVPVLVILVPYIMYLIISSDSEVDKQAGESKHAVAQVIILPSLFLAAVFNFALLEHAFVSEDHFFSPRYFVINVSIWLLIWFGYNVQYIEPNHSIGIVTPWTVKSRGVWVATHTVAGYVLQIAGLVLFICAIFVPLGFPLLIVTLILWLGSLVFVCFYSWFISGGAGDEPFIPK